MDGDRFDALTRALAGGTSRRRVLKGLGGALVGASGLGGGGGAAAAAADACAEALRSCLAEARERRLTADACRAAFADCRQSPPETCLRRGEHCSPSRPAECCSGVCQLIPVFPFVFSVCA